MANTHTDVYAPFLHAPSPNRIISVLGIPQTDGNRVSISLKNNSTGHHIFHMALWYSFDDTTIILNTSGEFGWDNEVAFRNINLLTPNERFMASILYEPDGYHINIDNRFTYSFVKRYNQSLSNRLVIEGQVLLISVNQQ
ncbi:uncharacterized protein [Onthophagus taurus]|uniref:uncharacterized protein n=1 Tax=Onthophagus taurus TaxID=166361 RepID=UPI0039BE54EE